MKIPLLRTRKAKVIAALVGVAGVGLGAFLVSTALEGGRPEVELATVTQARLTKSVTAVGDIEAGDRNVITLSPSVKVVEVLVAEGQRVARGDVLAVLDTSEYQRQLEQQGISLDDAESTLGHLVGPNSAASGAASANAVSQARVALEGAQAAEAAARRTLAALPALSDASLAQLDLALQGAILTADAARDRLDSVRDLGSDAVRQASIALDAAHDACERAARNIHDLDGRLASGLVTQAEYDVAYPPLAAALRGAETSFRSAQVALDTARTTADANEAAAEKAVADADLAVASADAALTAASLRDDTEREAAAKAVADASRAVRSAQIALSNAQSGASAARANDSERVSNQGSQIALIDANIRSLQDKVEQGRLRAAVDGVVSRVDAAADQYPQLGDTIVVEGTFGYVASVDVNQADSVGVRPGQPATVTLKGIGTTFQGTVAGVAPVAEKSATSADQHPKVTVEVSILAPDDTLRIGYEADVDITLEDRPQALQVSVDAVRREAGSSRPYAWVVDDRDRITRVFLRTGIESEGFVEVLSGLEAGQHCIVDPDDSLTEGATVRIAGGRR